MYKQYNTAVLFIAISISIASCQSNPVPAVAGTDTSQPEKFEPADGKVILFVGQELDAIGGAAPYTDGYFDHFTAPGGFTQYTGFHAGKNSPGLKGLTSYADWGDGPEDMSVTTTAPLLKNSCLAIGLDISNGNDSVTAAGDHDSLIYKLANWIKNLSDRPVFLRIGYEFNGHEWNHYQPAFYIAAWKRIKNKFDSMSVSNVAYVWQSKGIGTTKEELSTYYPGDEYVNWVAYSYFIPADSSHPMIPFAREHKKPLFIAESSPVFLDSNGICKPLDLTKQPGAEWAWKEWFMPYFRTIQQNKDVIKAIHYINSHWKSRPLWKDNPYFKNIDARITKNDSLKAWWSRETTGDSYLNASDTLFRYLSGSK